MKACRYGGMEAYRCGDIGGIEAWMERVVKLLLRAAAGDSLLDVVDSLLAANADVNAAILQAAAEGGHLDVVGRLLAAKAHVNAAAAEYCGRTALQAAGGRGHLEVVDRLLLLGRTHA